MYRPISLAAAVLASLALVGAASAPARAATPSVAPAEPLVLVRPGDRQLSCIDLAAEINGLARPAVATEAAEKPRKKGGFGFLKVLGSAMPIVGGLAGAGSMIASSVAGAAASGSMQDRAGEQMDAAMRTANAAMAGPSLADQRKERLVAIFEQKGC